MDIDVFNEATELYNKYKLCEEVLEYLSNEESVKGQKYKETLAKFAETFKSEFMMFVHERMTASGEAFEECGKCTCDNCPVEEEPEQPTPPIVEPTPPPFPEDATFQLGDRVVVNGNVGTIAGYDFIDHKYAVLLDSDDEEPIWADESELEKYEDNG